MLPAGTSGSIVDMKELGVWEPYQVKAQTLKTAVESATLLLRIDDIVRWGRLRVESPTAAGGGQVVGR